MAGASTATPLRAPFPQGQSPLPQTAFLHPRPGSRLTAHERSVLEAWGWTYEIREWWPPGADAPVDIISCRVCRHDSYHPQDLTHLYCSFCNAFHEDRERAWAAEATG